MNVRNEGLLCGWIVVRVSIIVDSLATLDPLSGVHLARTIAAWRRWGRVEGLFACGCAAHLVRSSEDPDGRPGGAPDRGLGLDAEAWNTAR